MLILRIALLTCVFYMLIAVLLQGALFLLASYKGGVIFGGGFRTWASLFAVVWLVSFSAAFYVANVWLSAKLQR